MKRSKIFLFAVLLPCIAFALTAMFAFKPDGGKPVIETSVKQTFEDSDWYYDPLEAERDADAADTWAADGYPGGDDIKAMSDGKFNHYCCATSIVFATKGERLNWVDAQMGPGNSNHVHDIQWEEVDDYPYPPYCCGYRAKVKYWTSAPCSTLCDW